MSVFEVHSGGSRRDLVQRFMNKSKRDAVSELVDFHLLNCTRIEKLEAAIVELTAALKAGSWEDPAGDRIYKAYHQAVELTEGVEVETLYDKGRRLFREGKGMSCLWGECKSDDELPEVHRGWKAEFDANPAGPKS